MTATAGRFTRPVLTDNPRLVRDPSERHVACIGSHVLYNLEALSEYKCSSLATLPYTSFNILFVGIRSPPSNVMAEQRVLIKCTRTYPHDNPLNIAEHTVLRFLNVVMPSGCTVDDRYWVRIPRLLDHLPGTQVQEYLLHGVNLDCYIRTHLRRTTAPERYASQNIGRALGHWVWRFHEKAKLDPGLLYDFHAQPGIELHVADDLKNRVYHFALQGFSRVHYMVLEYFHRRDKEHDALSEDKHLIHGEFQPENIVLSDMPTFDAVGVDMMVVDWEMVHLGRPYDDLGMMIAYLYILWKHRNIAAAEWIIEGFCFGYDEEKDDDSEDEYLTQQLILDTMVVAGVYIVAWARTTRLTTRKFRLVVGDGMNMIINACQGRKHYDLEHAMEDFRGPASHAGGAGTE